MNIRRKPDWLKIKIGGGVQYKQVQHLVEENNLHTICSSGKCPNIGECWSRGTATLMILGDICTRSCKFCATKTGKPLPPDIHEPQKLANTVRILKLRHVVITSVDRDDLDDFGASLWAETIRACRSVNPDTVIEVLVPDFQNNTEALRYVCLAAPDIIAHNVETVRRLTPFVRSKADYDTSMKVLKYFSDSGLLTKSGFMLGLGETHDEILDTINDLYYVGCRILTIGQYLQPTPTQLPVVEYIHPDSFEFYKKYALDLGYYQVESAPLVRSSYMAEQSFHNLKNKTVSAKENVSLKLYNTFRMNVFAKKVIEISDKEQLPAVFSVPSEDPFLVLGSGSNVLFTGDYPGTIIHISTKGIEMTGREGDFVLVQAAAGEIWDDFVSFCMNNKWYGLENLSHIPGTVGASVVQNIGAFGVEAAKLVEKVEVFSISDGSVQWKDAAECDFAYRYSRFKNDWNGKYIVTSVKYKLSLQPDVNLSYAALKNSFSEISQVSPEMVRAEVIKIRTSRLPDVNDLGNAGSFFKNPVVSAEELLRIQSGFPDVVCYPAEHGCYKLAAAWLIEHAGWKGKRFGDAGVHEKQSLVLVNYGNASPAEIITLSENIQSSVREMFGVDLEREVILV